MGMYPLSLLESRVAAQGMELCIDSRKATPGCVSVSYTHLTLPTTQAV